MHRFRNLGHSYLRVGDAGKALEQFERCVSARPNNAHCRQMVHELRAQVARSKPQAQLESGASRGSGQVAGASGFASIPALTDASFETHRRSHPKLLVMFFAPWCSHCTEMKAGYAAASDDVSGSGVAAASVDCTANAATCEKQGITGYPEVLYFATPEAAGEPYRGDRSRADIARFVKGRPRAGAVGTRAEAETDQGGHGGHTFKHARPLASRHALGEFRRAHPRAMVMFFAPWCSHCVEAIPAYDAAAANANREGMGAAFGAVDCDATDICSAEKIDGYPT